VVTALDEGLADWIIVTNGKLWRLYGKHAHARATNFYEVDLPEAMLASGEQLPRPTGTANQNFVAWSGGPPAS
jgi:hypothetical protein